MRRHEPKSITEKWQNQGDILVNSTGQGTLGRTAQWFGLLKNVTVDSHVTIVRPKEDKLVFYLGQLIMSREAEIEDMASGSTGQTELSRNQLGSLNLVLPKSEELIAFSAIIEPLVKMRVQNNNLTDYLSKLRDTLLPQHYKR